MSTLNRCHRAGASRILLPGLMLTVLLVAGLATAATPEAAAPANASQPATAAAAEAVAAPAAPLDLGQALRAVVEESRVRLRELNAAAKAAPDAQQVAALRAEATAIHAQMERRLLEVQREYAQRAGNDALVAELDGILWRLDRPAVGVPQERPAPLDAPPSAANPQPAPAAR